MVVLILLILLLFPSCVSEMTLEPGPSTSSENITNTEEDSSEDIGIEVKSCSLPENTTVALFGDTNRQKSGLGSVLNLSELSGTDLYVLLGDYAYTSDPVGIQEFFDLVDELVPPERAITAVMGNHDADPWQPYAEYFDARIQNAMASNSNFTCSNLDDSLTNLGRNSFCTFYDLLVIQSGILQAFNYDGSSYKGPEYQSHIDYIDDVMSTVGINSLWRITALHPPTTTWNVEAKNTNDLEPFYGEMIPHGTWIVAGHAHHYARGHAFHSMVGTPFFDPKGGEGTDLDDSSLDSMSDANATYLRPGVSATLVNGLGGQGPRDRERCFSESEPACKQIVASHTKTEGATPSPLLCTFNYNGDCTRAHCVLKSAANCHPDTSTAEACLAGEIIDEFDIYTDALGF